MTPKCTSDSVVPPRRVKLRKPVTPEDIADAELRGAAGQKLRCEWAQRNPDLTVYHDKVWGQPPANDDECFERMTFEIFHAGLSWTLVWNKREGLRRAFDRFEIGKVARYAAPDVDRLLDNPEIVRSEKKIDATIFNARMALKLQAEHGDLETFLRNMPPDNDEKSKILKKTFKFMGPGVSLGFLYATGLVPPPHHPYCYKVSADV